MGPTSLKADEHIERFIKAGGVQDEYPAGATLSTIPGSQITQDPGILHSTQDHLRWNCTHPCSRFRTEPHAQEGCLTIQADLKRLFTFPQRKLCAMPFDLRIYRQRHAVAPGFRFAPQMQVPMHWTGHLQNTPGTGPTFEGALTSGSEHYTTQCLEPYCATPPLHLFSFTWMLTPPCMPDFALNPQKELPGWGIWSVQMPRCLKQTGTAFTTLGSRMQTTMTHFHLDHSHTVPTHLGL